MNENLAKRIIGSASKNDFFKNQVLWNSGGVIFHKEDMFRLIELTIRECAEVLRESKYQIAETDYYDGFNEGLEYSANRIEELFGIE